MDTETRQCKSCSKDFVIEPDDFGFYEKMKTPPPTWCPDCRMQRRLIWRNPQTMYKRTCDATGKEVFSMFHPDVDIKMYDRDYWWSDDWSAKDYGRDYDFNRPFFEQMKDMIREVPWPSRSAFNLVNSDYCMNASDLKNCYLCFNASYNENCYYCIGIAKGTDCMDITEAIQIEKCYDSFYIAMGYGYSYADNCDNSRDLILCKDVQNSHDCIGCVNLRNAKYCIFNEQYTKEEYEQKKKEMQLNTYSGLQKARQRFNELKYEVPVKYAHVLESQRSSGDYIWRCKNAKDCFIVDGSEDMRYCQGLIHPPYPKNCYDYSFFGKGAENIYECSSVGANAMDVKFSHISYTGASSIEYSLVCVSSQNMLGCVNIRNGNYCILNKEYSKEEFIALREKIIKHMDDMPYTDKIGRVYKYGENFPAELAPFAYNNTVAQEYFKKTQKQVEDEGLTWAEPQKRDYSPTMSWTDIPDSINDVSEDIAKELILCKAWDDDQEVAKQHNCTQVFRVLPVEVQFCKNQGVPLPRKCFNSRHHDRLLLRNDHTLYDGKCMCAGTKSDPGKANNYEYQNKVGSHTSHEQNEHCANTFKTPYGPDRQEIVYCEQCYQAEVA